MPERSTAAAIAIGVALSVTSLSTAAPPEQWQPVDQAVADMDGLSTSLRHVGSGLRLDGEHTSLYESEPDALGQVRRYRVGPGFVARVDRLDYLVRRDKKQWIMNASPREDGEFIELAPLDTVYELTPPAMLGATRVDPGAAGGPDRRVDARVNRQVDGRVGAAPSRGSAYINGSRRITPHAGVAKPVASGTLTRDREQRVVEQTHAPESPRDQRDDAAR